MKKFTVLLLMLLILSVPVNAMEYTAPTVPESAQSYMPRNAETFGQGMWEILKFAVTKLQPSFAEASASCLAVIAVTLLLSLVGAVSDSQTDNLLGAVSVGLLFLRPTHILIGLGTETITSLHEYGKLLLPVMTSALAAQGGITSSAVLYTGSALFCSLLTAMISKWIVPMLYVFLCLSIARCALEDDMLTKLHGFIKWLMTWCLKTVLYVFTGYLTISGIVGGTADASAVKAAKLAISGMVPVVGGILADASESVLVTAGLLKNSAGIYGLLAMTAIWIGPFVKIGCQYLLMKLTSAVCHGAGPKRSAALVEDFASAMGFTLAMTGSVCIFLMVSIVCFMKGVG